MDSRQLDLLLAGLAGALVTYGGTRLLRRVAGEGVPTPPARDAKDMNGSIAALRSTTPHPHWTPPNPLPAPFSDKYHDVDPATTPSAVLYPLVISAIVPRPIAFISTLNAAGSVGNLAPYSYFNAVAHDPPTLAIGFCASSIRDHRRKDSLVNIVETGELVVNIISEWFVEAANHCCGNFDYGQNEFELSGLTPMPSVKVKAPRVRESAVQMECKVVHSYEVRNAAGAVSTTVILAQVVLMHVADGVAGASPSGKLVVDLAKYAPISRLGGNTYGRVKETFDLPRPDRTPAQKHIQYTSQPE
ncbi:hypothetical protein ACKKBF_B18175 [Auxenochlorella protothecoides x Auxenochlorella symbiontica]